MERETLNTPLHTGYCVSGTEWGWFHSTLLFCADTRSYLPGDLGHWCWQPFQAVAVTRFPGYMVPNAYGPAMAFGNENNAINNSHGWLWDAPAPYGQTGTIPSITEWTLALGWDKRDATQTNALRIVHLYNMVTAQNYLLKFNPGTGNYEWITWLGTLTGTSNIPAPRVTTTGNTVVITSQFLREMVIYADGKEVARGGLGGQLEGLRFIYVGCDAFEKENVCLGGTIGPLILSRSAWSPAQAAQWAADPWGWCAPAWVPQKPLYSPLVGDVQTRSGVAGDAQSRAAVDGDAQTRAAAIADAQARAAVAGDAQSQAAVITDVQTQED